MQDELIKTSGQSDMFLSQLEAKLLLTQLVQFFYPKKLSDSEKKSVEMSQRINSITDEYNKAINANQVKHILTLESTDHSIALRHFMDHKLWSL